MQITINERTFPPHTEQSEILARVAQLPGIRVTRLVQKTPTLQSEHVLREARHILESANEASDDSKRKIELLEQSFTLYKTFIKANQRGINEHAIRRAHTESIFLAEDIVSLLNDGTKKQCMELALSKLRVTSGYSSAAHSQSVCQTVDALNIPQRHFAVASQPLGTTNVKDCVFLVIKNKVNNLTFASHVDFRTDPASLVEAIKQYFPSGDPMDSYIIGGHLQPNESTIPDNYFVNITTVSNVLAELNQSGYNCSSRWCILHKDTPVNIVFDPAKDQFIEGVPGKELPSYLASEILIYLNDEHRVIPFFIENHDESNYALALSSQVQQKLLLSFGQKNKLLTYMMDNLPTSLLTYQRFKAITKAYSDAIKELIAAVKERCSVSDLIIQQLAMDTLRNNTEHSLYMLQFSKEKNKPLIDQIVKKVLEHTDFAAI